jgi:glyoxylase-like metal-dependent hydrolase (beta-lactamase superfamily II)
LLPGDGDCLQRAFEIAGVDPSDVTVVALSHLHNDHAGGLRWFIERCPVFLQRSELAYGLSDGNDGDHPEEHGFCRIDYDDRQVDWQLGDGDVSIAPGLRAVWTPGHTPGHQSFVVTLEKDAADDYGVPGFVLAFDAADLQRNIDDELAPGSLVTGNVADGVESIRRLKAIAAQHHFHLVPGHDPHAWQEFTSQLGVPSP